jgi:hypothetical protein
MKYKEAKVYEQRNLLFYFLCKDSFDCWPSQSFKPNWNLEELLEDETDKGKSTWEHVIDERKKC